MAETEGAVLLRHAERLHVLEGDVHLDASPPGRGRRDRRRRRPPSPPGSGTCREAGVVSPAARRGRGPPRPRRDDPVGRRLGEPVALAARNRPAAGIVRVGRCSPAPRRRQGWGAAVTTAATQATLDEGATAVVLFTDLTNATSTALYRRLGYVPVGDRLVLRFDLTAPG